MFGIGTWEFMLILILALIVLGPSKLPGIAKSLGRGYNEFKRASQELRDSLTEDVDISDFRNTIDDARRSLEAEIAFPDNPADEDRFESALDEIKPSDAREITDQGLEEATSETPQGADARDEEDSAHGLHSRRGQGATPSEPADDGEKADVNSSDSSREEGNAGRKG